MAKIKFISNSEEISYGDQWKVEKQFDTKFKLVDEKGALVSTNFKGRTYRIITKVTREFPQKERAKKIFLLIVLAICTLGLALLSKSFRNNCLQKQENIFFALLVPRNCLPKGIDSAKEDAISKNFLEEGISISPKTIAKISSCSQNIYASKDGAGIHFLNGKGSNRIFTLDDSPEFVFKLDLNDLCLTEKFIPKRFNNMVKGQTAIRVHELGLLVIPHAKLLTVNINGKECSIIAEKKMDIAADEGRKELDFQLHATKELVKQLAIFICKTGYKDVEWRNNPLIHASDDKGNKQIALIDLETMEEPEKGLFGGFARGLVGCVTEAQGKIVKEVALQNGVDIDGDKFGFRKGFAEAHAQRKQEIEADHKLKEYYLAKHIHAGSELIQFDEKKLQFPDYPEKVDQLRIIAKMVIDAINAHITKSTKQVAKYRRQILLNIHKLPFSELNRQYLEERFDSNAFASTCKTDLEYSQYNLLGHVLKKLADLKVIYKVMSYTGHGYALQA